MRSSCCVKKENTMGSWLAVLATSCACSCCTALTSSVFGCCGSAAKVCSLSTGSCSVSQKHSVIGRVLYAVIFVLFAVLAWVLRNLPFWINSVSYFHWIPGLKIVWYGAWRFRIQWLLEFDSSSGELTRHNFERCERVCTGRHLLWNYVSVQGHGCCCCTFGVVKCTKL